MDCRGVAVKSSHAAAARLRAVPAALAAVLLVVAPLRLAAQAPPPAPVPRGDLEITVVAPAGKKFQDCTVVVRDQVLSFGERSGPLTATGVPAFPDESIAVTADARVAQGAGKPTLRFAGVAAAAAEAGKTVKVTVNLQPADDINKFCAACHPGRGQRVRPGQIKRDAHPSGELLEGRYRDQVRIYNEKVERLVKEGKPHNEPIVVETRIVKVGGKDVKKDFYTCESCHTLHATTPINKYMRAPYLEQSDLCTGCHF